MNRYVLTVDLKDDPAAIATYKQYQADYRRVVANIERNYKLACRLQRLHRGKGFAENLRQLDEAKEGILRYEADGKVGDDHLRSALLRLRDGRHQRRDERDPQRSGRRPSPSKRCHV